MTRYLFSLVIILGIVFGLLLPELTLIWKDYLTFLLALLMFFSALRVERDELIGTNPRELLGMLLFVFVVMPLLALPFKFSQPLTFVGVLIAFSSPSAAATAFFSSFIGGDITLGVYAAFISSLLSTVTLPFTIQVLAGTIFQVDNYKILVILVEVIIIPILIALVSKKFFKKVTEKISSHRNYQLIVMFMLNSGIIGISNGVIKGNEYQLLELTAIMLLIMLFGGALAYFFGRRYGNKHAITFFVATSVKNAMLAFAIVLELFGMMATLPMVANLIAQYLILVLFEIFGKKS